MAEFDEPKFREWYGGLFWGGILLAFTAMFVWLLAGQIRDARASVPTLSPTSLAEFELDEFREQLVDVEGFTIDCDSATFAGERLLAPGVGPGVGSTGSALILVEFEHGSDCREAVAEQRGPFRAQAKAASAKLLEELGVDEVDGLELAIIEPHEVGYWMIALIAGFGGIGVFFVVSAFSTRKQLIAKLRADPGDTTAAAEAEPDDRRPSDPYRPGKAARLIIEPIAPAPEFLAKLRRVRRLQVGFGVVVLAGALTWACTSGAAIYEREQIWSKGVVAKDAIATGETRRSAAIAVSTTLEVTFVDRAGRLHREEASAFSLFVGVDDAVPPVVRYMPDEPERFAVSWIHEQLWGSVMMLVLCVGGLLAFSNVLLVSARGDRRPEQAVAVFVDPREALLELITIERQVVNGSETGSSTYHFRVCNSERILSHFVADKRTAPLLLDAGMGLALYNPRDPDYLLVLTEELAELASPPFTVAQLRGRFLAQASSRVES